ncbi:MAG: hypothetical protein B6D59_01610 [Campylobacteraceae bacterium 4484_4]|nr:MAG: hypothetical protein B6D59_01610 [Campylobacteraceae bacterium 4484_4]
MKQFENALLIVADLGELKVFKIVKKEGVFDNEVKISYVPEPVTDLDYIAGHKKLQDLVSDEAGRFGHSHGEAHNLESEVEKRTLKDIATDITTITERENADKLLLAFPKEHFQELMESLSEEVKSKILKAIEADLVKTHRDELLAHFE